MSDNAIWSFSIAAASNANADSTAPAPELWAASQVNNTLRAYMARHAAFLDILGGDTDTVTYGGSSNAYTITSPSGHALTSLPKGGIFLLQANHTNTGAATLQIDALSAFNLRRSDGSALAAGDIVSGGSYLVRYTGSVGHILGQLAGGSFQPLDADLTSWASVSRASGFDAFVATPSSANLRALITDESGTGALLFAGAAIGTPASGTLTNCTGLPISSGVAGLGAGVATALAVNVGSAGAFVTFGGALGTPSGGTLTNCIGLPVSSGIAGFGTGVATALAVNVGSAGAFVVNGGALGTPASGTLTNCTGLPISTGVSGLGSNVATALAASGRLTNLANSTGVSGTITVSTSDPSGGSDGDLWIKYTP